MTCKILWNYPKIGTHCVDVGSDVQKPTAAQNKPPLKILQTLSTVLQNAAEHESKSKKTLPRNMPTHDATNKLCRGHKMQEGHTLTKLSNPHNSCYCSWSLTLPNYFQHNSKIIISTTIVSHFINQRTLVFLKDNKILSETSNLWVTKICGKHSANCLCCY